MSGMRNFVKIDGERYQEAHKEINGVALVGVILGGVLLILRIYVLYFIFSYYRNCVCELSSSWLSFTKNFHDQRRFID